MKRKMSLRIYFENEQDKLPLTYKMKMLVREAIEATLDFEDFRNTCEVSVTFTDNAGAAGISWSNTHTNSIYN